MKAPPWRRDFIKDLVAFNCIQEAGINPNTLNPFRIIVFRVKVLEDIHYKGSFKIWFLRGKTLRYFGCNGNYMIQLLSTKMTCQNISSFKFVHPITTRTT